MSTDIDIRAVFGRTGQYATGSETLGDETVVDDPPSLRSSRGSGLLDVVAVVSV
jgi:hypothetical protein